MDDPRKLLTAESLNGLPGGNGLAERILHVVFNDHRHDIGAVGMGPGLHRQHLTGNRSMDRHAKAGVVTNFLSHCDQIALFHQRLTGCADVHAHGDHHSFGCRKALYGHLAGQGFFIIGMYPAEKSSHILHLSKFICPRLFVMYQTGANQLRYHSMLRRNLSTGFLHFLRENRTRFFWCGVFLSIRIQTLSALPLAHRHGCGSETCRPGG